MPTDVVMPQMGESVAEGTIVRWIKRVGETIDRDEPLFEISTDKVDAEIPSPESGVLLEIRVNEGETVPVHSVVAIIGAPGERIDIVPDPLRGRDDAEPQADGVPSAATPAGMPPSIDEVRRTRSSPVVRRMAVVHGLDITRIAGTGISGRVTKKDVDAYLAGEKRAGARADEARAQHAAARSPAVARQVAFEPGQNTRVEPMSVMRRKIAEHMIASVRTSPHVYQTYEVDFGRVEELRNRRKADYEAAGAKLSVTAFIAKATADALREFPFANASIEGDNVIYKREINLGIAVALDQGLIVPVIRRADERTMFELSQAVQDLAARARTKQLRNEEVHDGTFTITNPGIFGAMMGQPIINQPQVAILAVGSVERRVVVIDDMIAIRPTAYFTLGHDHRLIDGADGARFLRALKGRIENFDESVL